MGFSSEHCPEALDMLTDMPSTLAPSLHMILTIE